MKICFLGPVATGKTTWARIFSELLNAKFIDVEGPGYHTIDVLLRGGTSITGEEIELIFLGSEVYLYLSTYYKHKRVVYASHPAVVLFYAWTLNNETWLIDLVDKMLDKLPRPDLSILFTYELSDVEELLTRIGKRARLEDRKSFEAQCIEKCYRYYPLVKKTLEEHNIEYITIHIKEPAQKKLRKIVTALAEKGLIYNVDRLIRKGIEILEVKGLT